jgi:hypothetical protein
MKEWASNSINRREIDVGSNHKIGPVGVDGSEG